MNRGSDDEVTAIDCTTGVGAAGVDAPSPPHAITDARTPHSTIE
jgi:hypothetical protein